MKNHSKDLAGKHLQQQLLLLKCKEIFRDPVAGIVLITSDFI